MKESQNVHHVPHNVNIVKIPQMLVKNVLELESIHQNVLAQNITSLQQIIPAKNVVMYVKNVKEQPKIAQVAHLILIEPDQIVNVNQDIMTMDNLNARNVLHIV